MILHAQSLAAGRSARVQSPDPIPPETFDFAALAARTCYPVLIAGETGSGKTHLARLIHQLSTRSKGPFVRVNCASIPDSLFETEMFGCVRGAFTDARESREGMFEAAHRGTLFLDEIGEMPLHLQSKLLTALEEGAIRRVGATRQTPLDVRIIVASNRDLHRMVEEKTFREDLFYRCAVLEYRVPPLRERLRDLPVLVEHLLERITEGFPRPEIGNEALDVMRAYAWPGNIRELENVLRQAAAYAHTRVIDSEHLPERVRTRAIRGEATREDEPRRARYSAPTDAEDERAAISTALREEAGNKTRAARRLGMSRSALWIKMQRHAISSEAFTAIGVVREE
ncbi:MAG: sigma 54-interacting transcriptional regulator [Gemmatimonadota bacterium]|nr:sigma 54-interacting transcriptional regulator [Gemmatimonadota bacterium]